jgi:hypothetical protein
MRKALAISALFAAAAGVSWAAWTRLYAERPAAAPAPSSAYPGGHPIDAAQVSTGKLAVEVMPPEVTGALELHSAEIVRTAEELATKQARITGACAPGSAIRLVGEDGSVVCQRLPRGVASVAAVAAVARLSSTGTAQGTVPGGVGRFQSSGEDDFLVAPLALPDGAIVTGFSYTYWDADERVDGAAYLYRSDDAVLAGVATEGARGEVRFAETDLVKERRVDNAAYGYFVYFQVSAQAGASLMPIAAAVSYRLP